MSGRFTLHAHVVLAVLAMSCDSTGSQIVDTGTFDGVDSVTVTALDVDAGVDGGHDTDLDTDTTTVTLSPWTNVLSVTVSGSENAYVLAVEIASSDTGCDQYNDWWEVLTPSGELLFRHTLAHAHLAGGVSGNPFTRAGGPVPIGETQEVIIRGHMNSTNYAGIALRGSVGNGFVMDTLIDADFAANVEKMPPQPPACDPNLS